MNSFWYKMRLRHAAHKMIIPSKNRLLPQQAFEENSLSGKIAKPLPLKFAAQALALVMAAVLAFIGIGYFSSHGENMPNHDGKDKVVIAAEGVDQFSISICFNAYNGKIISIPNSCISPNLQEMMDEFGEQDVLFRIKIGILLTNEDKIAYKQLCESKGYLYGSYSKPDEISFAFIREICQKRLDYAKTIAPVEVIPIEKLSEYPNFFRPPFIKEVTLKDMHMKDSALLDDFLGGLTLEWNASYSYYDDISSPYLVVMELPAQVIKEMAASGQFFFSLAPPKRVEGYSPKLSDYCTYLVDQMNKEDTLDVAVVTVLDYSNLYVLSRGIPANEGFNREFFKPWDGIMPKPTYEYRDGVPYDKDGNPVMTCDDMLKQIFEYMKNIWDVNRLWGKLIHEPRERLEVELNKDDYNKHLNSINNGEYDDSFLYSMSAGFMARLRKEEILDLAKDENVKAIFPVARYYYKSGMVENHKNEQNESTPTPLPAFTPTRNELNYTELPLE